MAVDTHELASLQPLLDELAAVRAGGDHIPTGLSYEILIADDIAKKREEEAVERVVEGVNNTDDAELNPFQKAIASDVFLDIQRASIPESLDLISDGFRAFERVEEDAERNRGTVAFVGNSTIALFTSHGKDDLSVETTRGSIELRLADGMEIEVPSMKDGSFPDPAVREKSYVQTLVRKRYGSVAAGLAPFDPASEKYDLPFVRLGTPEEPTGELDDHIEGPEARFAARFLISILQKDGWIHIASPGEELRAKVVDELSSVYVDILFGATARDEEERIRNRYLRIPAHTFTGMNSMRKRGLATYDRSNRDALLYAADTTPSDIEAATREKIAKHAENAQSANEIVGSLRAAQLLETFFQKLNEN